MVRLSYCGHIGGRRVKTFWFLRVLSLSLIFPLPSPVSSNVQTKITLLNCISQELPATVSPRFQECIESARTSGTVYRFIIGFECILRLANAIRPDRSVNVGTLFTAVGDFKGTRFEKAALECQAPLPAMKFTICMLEHFRKLCRNRIRTHRPSLKSG
ncbi:uncharacterized protein LOC111263831 [Varroa jacobsoni]|uniref:Uncharacterized protein n=1 Tax=Varroa destructor TaxID=109461 RepID=A0A7M7JNU9_VARDE|nr:uncharacterized protein LOC111247806 isoform X2 [Varroa destructor]XP_022694967.1 uncharacterized protein LOC111263831 [Varroa jacobsoni]